MATATRICKVCGKEYEYCHALRRDAGVFRWQDVACCKEHGKQYLDRVLAARSGVKIETEPEENKKNDVEYKDDLDNTPVIFDVDDEDEDAESDFDENDEEDIIIETK